MACLISNLHVCILNKRTHCCELCFFAIVKFSVAADSIANFDIPNILRHWGVTFIGNFIGGGLLMGLPYAFLNKKMKILMSIKEMSTSESCFFV